MTKIFGSGIWQSKRGQALQAAALVPVLIAFTACGGAGGGGAGGGGAGGGGGSIAGRVNGPTDSNLNQTVVAAFVCNNACQADSDITNTVGGRAVISSTSASANYQLANVPAGKYFVLAFQDSNGSGKLDAGDLLGAVSGVPSPAANVDIALKLATAADAPSPQTLERLRLLGR